MVWSVRRIPKVPHQNIQTKKNKKCLNQQICYPDLLEPPRNLLGTSREPPGNLPGFGGQITQNQQNIRKTNKWGPPGFSREPPRIRLPTNQCWQNICWYFLYLGYLYLGTFSGVLTFGILRASQQIFTSCLIVLLTWFLIVFPTSSGK